jgi:hypothetical protein
MALFSLVFSSHGIGGLIFLPGRALSIVCTEPVGHFTAGRMFSYKVFMLIIYFFVSISFRNKQADYRYFPKDIA